MKALLATILFQLVRTIPTNSSSSLSSEIPQPSSADATEFPTNGTMNVEETPPQNSPNLHPTNSQTNTTSLPKIRRFKNYIVTLNPNVSQDNFQQHAEWVYSTFNGTYGYNLTTILNNTDMSGLSDNITLAQYNVSELVAQKSLERAKGPLGTFALDSYKGYHGQFPAWMVRLLNDSSYVYTIEKDFPMSLNSVNSSNHSSPFTKQGYFASYNLKTEYQDRPGWNLDRITHRSKGFVGQYVYPQEPGKNVDIYILDTGIKHDLPEFGNRASFGASFSAEGDEDVLGHGSHVAGIAAGKEYGVAKSANIIGVKVLNNDGKGWASMVMSGIEWVANNVAKTGRKSIINLSLGGDRYSFAMDQIVTAAVAQGIAFSVAAGNSNKMACSGSPQQSPLVLTVGASDKSDNLADFTNYGPCVNLYAPGADILSVSLDVGPKSLSGTSQAAPHAAGQMAIILAVNPDLKPVQLYEALQIAATNSTLGKLHEGDHDLLLFNGLPSPELGKGNSKADGSNFFIGGGGWALVFQVIFSIYM
ncbi:serine protease [Boothiomyces sp. JEL0866]|nr:serine protease [Boothiomyces sp. JEL0866]KAJ3325636.1 serine protease [Boothiomyces sp. JEL0866]